MKRTGADQRDPANSLSGWGSLSCHSCGKAQLRTHLQVPVERAGLGLGRAGFKVQVKSTKMWGNLCSGLGCPGQLAPAKAVALGSICPNTLAGVLVSTV